MRTPTDDEVTEALHANATEHDGRWYFRGGLGHDHESARDIVRSSLTLDVVVTDVLTSAAWAIVLRSVVALEERVDHLERIALIPRPQSGVWEVSE